MLNWQIGVEIELIAPLGLTRQSLAEKICPAGGSVKRFFHCQSEPSKLANTPIFENSRFCCFRFSSRTHS